MTDANTPDSTPVAGPPVPPAAVPAAAAAPAVPAPGAYGVPGAAPVELSKTEAPAAFGAPAAPAAYGVPTTAVVQSKAARFGFIFSILQFPLNVFGNNVLNGVIETGSAGALILGFVFTRLIVLAAIVAGLIFSIRGLRETKDGALKGRGLAIAGVIIAGIGGLIWIIATLVAAIGVLSLV